MLVHFSGYLAYDSLEIKKFCKEFKIKYLAVNHSCNLPIKICYDTPKNLGSDRIALCVGAHMTTSGDKLIIDIGTCITYDLLIQNNYIGGQISPGVYMRLNSLYSDTANLPKLNFDIISQDIGKTTKDSILIGVYEGILFEIEGVNREMAEEAFRNAGHKLPIKTNICHMA